MDVTFFIIYLSIYFFSSEFGYSYINTEYYYREAKASRVLALEKACLQKIT